MADEEEVVAVAKVADAEEINDEFVDVFFPDDPKYTFGDLGGALCTSASNFADVIGNLTDAEVRECVEFQAAHPGTSLEYLLRRAYNQKNEGSCVGNACTHGVEGTGIKQVGKDRFPELSAISCYKQIGRSAGSGAMVSDGMDALRDVGVLPLDTPKNREKFGNIVMPATGFSTPFPPGWKEIAKLFRGVEFYVLRSTASIYSALCKGFFVIVGREGHSILYCRVMLRNGRIVIKYINSWGQWGDSGGNLPSGFGYDTESQIKKSASWAFAIRSVTIPDNVLLAA